MAQAGSKRRSLIEAGEWLQAERERRGQGQLTQQQLGDALHVSKSVISNIERGTSKADDDVAEALAAFWGMDELVVRRRLGLWVPQDRHHEPIDPAAADAVALIAALADEERRLRAAEDEVDRADTQLDAIRARLGLLLTPGEPVEVPGLGVRATLRRNGDLDVEFTKPGVGPFLGRIRYDRVVPAAARAGEDPEPWEIPSGRDTVEERVIRETSTHRAASAPAAAGSAGEAAGG